jgi:HlyD family secretion protein
MPPLHVRRPRRKRRTLAILAVVSLTVAVVAAAGAAWRIRASRAASDRIAALPRAVVRRTSLFSSLHAPGQVDSSQSTLIECELEAMVFGTSSGRYMRTGGASRILEIVDDGSMVKQGDILARLDSTDYDELVRVQTVEVERSRAAHRSAELDLEAEQIRLKEYRDGQLVQIRESARGKIKLAESEFSRQKDRLEWTRRMVDLHYMPESRLSLQEQVFQQSQISLDTQRLALSILDTYKAPKIVTQLEASVLTHESMLTFTKMRLDRQVKQLAKYQEQVDHCTVRAPHDGFVIYANEDDDDTRIELGALVRQRQDLFRLPDLGHMEVQTLVHESMIDRVKEGMLATIRVEALPHVRLEGRVISVAPLPQSIRSWMAANDVKNFLSRIQIDNVPDGLLPGMTAEVELMTASRPDAIVIPPQAVTMEEGHEVCYVASPAGVERREVHLGANTPDMIEVVDGLDEGEQVVLHPADFVSPDQLIAASSSAADPPPPAPAPTSPEPAALAQQAAAAVTTTAAVDAAVQPAL